MSNLKQDFPFFFFNKQIVYLDNAASVHKPWVVVNAIQKFYTEDYSNVNRSVHRYDDKNSKLLDQARFTVQQFIHSKYVDEIIFTSGTTESINLVAYGYAKNYVCAGDEILITQMEHHSNIVPWQRLAKENNASLKIIPLLSNGCLDMNEALRLISSKTKILSVVHLSHVLGVINPVKKLIDQVHQYGGVVCIDAAQSIAHVPIHVQDLDCDFLAFSGHKAYGPTGVGVLYAKSS